MWSSTQVLISSCRAWSNPMGKVPRHSLPQDSGRICCAPCVMSAPMQRPIMAECTRELRRRFSPHVPERYLQQTSQAPKLSRTCPTTAEQLLRELRFGPSSAKPGRCWPTLGPIGTHLLVVGQFLTGVGQTGGKHNWSTSAIIWLRIAQPRP